MPWAVSAWLSSWMASVSPDRTTESGLSGDGAAGWGVWRAGMGGRSRGCGAWGGVGGRGLFVLSSLSSALLLMVVGWGWRCWGVVWVESMVPPGVAVCMRWARVVM